jgi:lycopene beta-cyclase
MKSFQYVFAGAGCAGLSLVYYMLQSNQLRNSQILLIDPCIDQIPSKTWCYWAKEPLEIHPKNLAIQEWKLLSIKSNNQKIQKELGTLRYFHLNSKDFYESIFSKIRQFENVTLLKDSVIEMEEIDGLVKIKTAKNGFFDSDYVFDSRLGNEKKESKKTLTQVFSGWTIESVDDLFDPNTITMMDFGNQTDDKFDFVYVLPFSKNKGLVEFTAYSSEPISEKTLERSLQNHLERLTNSRPYTITFRETGIIPMSTLITPKPISKKILPIGTAAGWTKASTGYTFHTIQKKSKDLIQKLESKKSFLDLNSKPKRFDFYDNILLNIAHKWPNKLPSVFFDLFGTSSPETVLRFLNEETSIWEEIKMLSKLRFKIFIKSLFQYEVH